MRNDNDDQSLSEKADEVEKCEEEPSTILNSSTNTSNSLENEEFLDEKVHTDPLNQLTLRQGLRHSSSYALYDNISKLWNSH